MTGPDGDKSHGWWRIQAVDPPRSLEVEDGFADDTGAPNPDLPTTAMRIALTEADGGTQLVITSTFASKEAMEELIGMGMEEGMRQSMAQMDQVLARVIQATAPHAAVAQRRSSLRRVRRRPTGEVRCRATP